MVSSLFYSLRYIGFFLLLFKRSTHLRLFTITQAALFLRHDPMNNYLSCSLARWFIRGIPSAEILNYSKLLLDNQQFVVTTIFSTYFVYFLKYPIASKAAKQESET